MFMGEYKSRLFCGRAALDAAAALGAPTTIFDPSPLDQQNNGPSDISFRVICPVSAGAATQVRVTFYSSATTGLVTTHCSIGIQTGAAVQTTATPTELLFSGSSGFTIGSNTNIVSDWLAFAGFTASDKLIVAMDFPSQTGGTLFGFNGPVGCDRYYAFSAQTYNSANPTMDGHSNDGSMWVVGLIEKR